MARSLYRLAGYCYNHKWRVIAAWMLLVILAVGAAATFSTTNQTNVTIGGTESQNALDKLNQNFASSTDATGSVVIEAPKGTVLTDAANASSVQALLADIGRVAHVTGVILPEEAGTYSANKQIAFAQVSFDTTEVNVLPSTVDAVEAAAQTGSAAGSGLTVAFAGTMFAPPESKGLPVAEIVGLIIAAAVLFVMFGSAIAAGLPLISALLGVGITVATLTAVGSLINVPSAAPILAIMVGIAVGIDYALFILNRHRSYLAQGLVPAEAAARAVATAGSSVVFAGATVIVALAGLVVVGVPFLSVMGVAAAAAAFVAVTIAVTFLPAVLGIAGTKLVPKQNSRTARRLVQLATTATADEEAQDARPTLGSRWVALVVRKPVVFIVSVMAIVGVLALPALSLNLNLPSQGQDPTGSTSRTAYDLLAKGFGPGSNGPLVVVADLPAQTDQTVLHAIGEKLAHVSGVSSVMPPTTNEAGSVALFAVIPTTAPDAAETKVTVQNLRDVEPAIRSEFGIPVAVTGQTAVAVDVSNVLTGALLPFALIVVGLSILLLTIVFRSIAVPVKAALGFVLSSVAAFGVGVAVIQWGWFASLLGFEQGPVVSYLPIVGLALLFGLAMDYEVFLVSGVRESYLRHRDANRAIRTGFSGSIRVVTAAALIMIFVFSGFIAEAGEIKQVGLILGVGVLVDAFLIRMTLVPAIMSVLGHRAWWFPAWLNRLLPHLDVEGDSFDVKPSPDAPRGARGVRTPIVLLPADGR